MAAAHVLSPTPIRGPIQYYSPSIQNKFSTERIAGPLPLTQSARYAEIGYAFDERKFIERTQARVRAGGLPKTVPRGWPKALHGPLVWTGSDFPDESVFLYYLTAQDKDEITTALNHFKTLGKKGKHVNRESFPLPNLDKKLLRIRDDVYQGRGFAILRGLDVQAFSEIDLLTVYLGLTSYVAEMRGKQNHRGAMLIHVVNSSEAVQAENAVTEMPFHTDLVCDVVSTLTKACGARGGSPILASAWTVYNELAATRPDLIHILAEPDWPFDTFNREPPFYRRALLHLHDDKLIANFSRRCLVGHTTTGPRTPGIPGLSEAQAEALDALHAIGRRHELKTSMQPGDIRFVNNMALMHRRDAFEDDNVESTTATTTINLDRRRQLMRLWLHSPDACWPLPPALCLAWERVYGDVERGERWDLLAVDGRSGRVCSRPIWDDDDDDDDENGMWSGAPEPPLRSHSPATACD